jgi:glycosyltransferase involved in cell wall biosynthesis
MKPDVILLDAGKDGNAALSFLHMFLSRGSKVYLPIYHYEPMRIGKHNWIGNFLAKILLYITYKLNEKLWKEAPALFAISKYAKEEIAEKLRIPEDKLVLTGCSIETHKESYSKKIQKDIDFLCVGRIGKFSHLIDIWKEIRKVKPAVNFHMAGIGRDNPIINELEKVGNFKHHGIVSEEEKVQLFKSSKVFIFPSLYEGFGIAVAEALSYGLPVVAWDLPVYKELWGDSEAVRRVEVGNYKSFAREAIYALEHYDRLSKEAKIVSSTLDKSWRDIARIVHDTIMRNL